MKFSVYISKTICDVIEVHAGNEADAITKTQSVVSTGWEVDEVHKVRSAEEMRADLVELERLYMLAKQSNPRGQTR